MNIVYKYKIHDRNSILTLTQGGFIIHTALILDIPYFWVLFNKNNIPVKIELVLFNTGENIGIEFTYAGTYHFANGVIQHLFYRTILDKIQENDI